jgi:two-component system, NarL family, nitrate/nitrite response regulator NarL
VTTNIANLNDDLDKNGNGERNTEVRVEPKTTVLVANAFPLVRNSIKDLLESTPNVHVVGCAKTKDEVLTLVELHHPQISIIDLEIEWAVLTEVVAKLARRDTHALVMSDELNEEKTFELLRAGANGIVSRRVDPELLCRSVKAVACGEIWVSRTATSQLIQRFRMHPAEPAAAAADAKSTSIVQAPAQTPVRDYGLTRREWDIVRAIGDAMSNKDIAVQLGISEYTVKHHLTNIYNKIGVYSRLELAMMATHHGLVNTNANAIA